MSAALSYSSGESATPLLGDTIGANFDATVRAFGDREALVDCPAGRRWTYAELAADVDSSSMRSARPRNSTAPATTATTIPMRAITC